MNTIGKMSVLMLIITGCLASGWVSAAGVGNNIAVRLVGTGAAYADADVGLADRVGRV